MLLEQILVFINIEHMEEWDMSNQQDDKLKKSMTKDNGKKKTTTSKLGIGIALGLIFGIAIDKIGLGIAIGVAIGTGISASREEEEI